MVLITSIKQYIPANQQTKVNIPHRLWLTKMTVIALSLMLAMLSHSIKPLELYAETTRDTERSYNGINDFKFARIETQLITPLLTRNSFVGNWFIGLDFSENRLFLAGSATGSRRLYRFTTPIQFYPKRSGRIQHEWMLTPAYYSDESLVSQKRFDLEYAWQMRYRQNSKISFVGGLRSDSRFGGGGIYPIIGLESRPSKHIFHHWVFPDIYTDVTLNKKTSLRGFLQVNGGNWKYLQADGISTGTLSISDWKVGMSLRFKTKMPFDIVTEAGMRFMGTGSIEGREGNLSNSFFVGVGLNAPFSLKSKTLSAF